MPPLVIPAGYAECEFIHTQNDTLQQAICTLGVNTDDTTLLNDIANLWSADMLAEMNNSFTYTQFRARVAGGTLLTVAFAQPGHGGGSGTSPQVSYLYRKNTLVPGRANHGRMYYPGCDETSVDADGRVASGKLTGLDAQATAFVSDLGALSTPVVPYILHHSALAPTAVNQIVAEGVVATQRRRLKRS